jgi:hypothetical protein
LDQHKNKEFSKDEIKQMEQDLIRMEMELNDFYCEAGRIILEKAEQQERKINNLVDCIIETRRKLMNAKNEDYFHECEEHKDQSNANANAANIS